MAGEISPAAKNGVAKEYSIGRDLLFPRPDPVLEILKNEQLARLTEIHVAQGHGKSGIEMLWRLLHRDPSLQAAWIQITDLWRREDVLDVWLEGLRAEAATNPPRAEIWMGLGLCALHFENYSEAGRAFNRALELAPRLDAAERGRDIALLFAEASTVAPTETLRATAMESENAAKVTEPAAPPAAVAPESKTEAPAATPVVGAEAPAAAESAAPPAEAAPAPAEAAPEAQASRDFALGDLPLAAVPDQVDTPSGVPDERSRRQAEASELQRQGKTEEAVALWSRLVTEDPTLFSGNWNLGLLYEQQGKIAEARDAFRRLVQHHASFADGWFRLGLTHHALKEHDPAAQAFETALWLRPTWVEAALNACLARTAMGELDTARMHCDNLARLAPGTPLAFQARATVALAEDHLPEAEEAASHLDRLDHPTAALFNNLAVHFQRGGDSVKASQWYQRAIEADPDLAEAYWGLAATFEDQGKLDLATPARLKALELRPEWAADLLG